MVWALALGWSTIYASRTCLFPLYLVIAEALGISSTGAGLLSGVYFMLYVILQIPAGLVMERLGTKRCLTLGYTMSSLALAGTALWGNGYGELLFFFALQGLGDSFYYSAAQGTIVSHTPPERKAMASALLGIGMAAGVLAGLGFSYMLYAALRSYRLPFLVLGVLRLGVAAILYGLVPNVPPSAGRTDLRDYLPVFRDAAIWKISLATFCLMYGFWVMANWGPAFLVAERGFAASRAGFYPGLMALASIPGGILWGRLSDRVGGKPVVTGALLLSGIFLFAFVEAGSSYIWIVLWLLAFGFCSNSAIIPVAIVWISRIAARRYPGKAVSAIAFANCVIVASATAAPVLSGVIRDLSGSLSGAIYLAAACVFVSPLLLRGVTSEKIG